MQKASRGPRCFVIGEGTGEKIQEKRKESEPAGGYVNYRSGWEKKKKAAKARKYIDRSEFTDG